MLDHLCTKSVYACAVRNVRTHLTAAYESSTATGKRCSGTSLEEPIVKDAATSRMSNKRIYGPVINIDDSDVELDGYRSQMSVVHVNRGMHSSVRGAIPERSDTAIPDVSSRERVM